MAGKRVRKKRMRAPAVLLLLAAMAVLLTTAGPRGVAADSPLQSPVEPVLEQQPEIAVPEARTVPEETAVQDGEVAEEPDAKPFAPVPESGPVEDTYFEDTAFLGDSRTEGFQLYSGLKTGTYYHAVGATVESVFSKDVETPAGKMPLLDAMAEKDFGKVYVMLGVNELGWSKTETFHDQYAKVIDRLREDHPDAEIVLQSILPVSAKQEAKKNYVNNERIAVYNEVIYRLAEEKDCALVDVAEAVTDENGCLRAEWNSDGVHLNVKGCRAWLEYLRTHPVGEPEHPTEAEAPAETEIAAETEAGEQPETP